MKTLAVYAALAACLGIAPAAVGQALQTRPLSHAGSNNPVLPTPEQEAKAEQSAKLRVAAARSLHAGRYAEAEAEARASLFLADDSTAGEVLAEALDAEGKTQEAYQAYHKMVVDEKAQYTRVLLPYALLLVKSGHWAQALAVYNQALPHLPSVGPHPETPIVQDGEVMRASSHFSPDTPEPTALATAIHIARGLVYNASSDWAHEPQNTEALAEYAKALQLAPNSPLTNYYYGTGWQQLSPSERTKAGSVQQAKAALQKAVLLGKGEVKKAALKALKDFNKTVGKPA